LTNHKISQGFTIFDRFLEVARTPSGRKHLRKTWKFALGQAYRAAWGIQVSDVLKQLDLLSASNANSLDLPIRPSFSREEFKSIAERLGAGKQSGHEFVYQYLDLDRLGEIGILEIGIGTNDPKAPSSMGKNGKPGSSLEMWTELFPNAQVVGADVDASALVTGDRIVSFQVDSTNRESIQNLIDLVSKSSGGFDVIIDDGLHTPESNLTLLNMLVALLKPGGFYIVEDVPKPWTGFWRTVTSSLAPSFDTRVISDSDSYAGCATFVILKRKQ
jgi:SAM-dependent methyltransferase